MMKKNGFTLAEVLITLAIIGVVATLTLPALMTNTGEQQFITGYKKMINTLSEAGQMNSALAGWNYSDITEAGSSLTSSVDETQNQNLASLLVNRTSLGTTSLGSITNGTDTRTNCAFFRDGSAVCLGTMANNSTGKFNTVIVDVNGVKGPNKLSTCTKANCTEKAGKNIKDQFYVTLYQGAAIPGKWTSVDTYGNDSYDKAALYAAGVSQKETTSGS